MTVHGIDVSEHQGAHIDWKKVRGRTRLRNRNRFVWMKVNEGDYLDTLLSRSRVRDAKAAGLIVGGYNFVRPRTGRTGAEEFDIFHDVARVVGLLAPGCLRPVIDIEVTTLQPAGTQRYVRSWINRCVHVTGKAPIVYTGKWFWSDVMLGDSLDASEDLHGAHLWLAAYVNNYRPYVPQTWAHPLHPVSFWQYTSSAKVPGIDGPCDRNKYLSSMKNLKRGHTL